VKEDGNTVGVNTLGFGGTLAVKNKLDLEYLRNKSPVTILELVSMPNPAEKTN
jgi:ATP adenylyltransferase/5',5'''-P-1,P-4-tetraphosphate phosphorylase II